MLGNSNNPHLLYCDHCGDVPLGGYIGRQCGKCGIGYLRLTPAALSTDQSEVMEGADARPRLSWPPFALLDRVTDEKSSTDFPVAAGAKGEGRADDPTPPSIGRAIDETASLLPLTLDLEDYVKTEKIGYPPRKLTTEDSSGDSDAGDIAYYAPWGNLAIFYKTVPRAGNGLIILGKINSNKDIFNVPGSLKATIELAK